MQCFTTSLFQDPVPLDSTAEVKLCLSSPPLLSSPGANVNVGRGGDSPLHAAVGQDDADQVSLLLDYGADVNLRDSNNQRPVELAPQGGKTQQLLQAFEGTTTITIDWCDCQ